MLTCLECKFSLHYNPRLHYRLIATHPSPLIEGNTWDDTYWGVDLRTGEGQNILGKLLQVVRENLINGQGRGSSEKRGKRREYFRAWRARRAAELKERNAEKAEKGLPPLPELPWAKEKRKGQGEKYGK